MGNEDFGSLSVDSPATTPTFSSGLAWLVVALAVFLVGGVTQNLFIGGAAFFSGGVSAALLVGATRKRLNPRRPVDLLPPQIQQLQSDLLAAQAEIGRLREEHEFDRQLGRPSSGPGPV
jgi:hypothetical protein